MSKSSASPRPEKLLRRRVKIVNEIIETLRQDIVSRRLGDGERLPNEKDLSERFGVSQPTVREAIRALETLGLVDVFHGSGTFVRSQGDYALATALQTLLQLENVGIMEVLDVRQVLGRHSIQQAASKATPEDLAVLEGFLAQFKQADKIRSVDQMTALIVAFQRAVSAAAHSPVLNSLESFLLNLLNEVQVKSLSGRTIRFWRARAMAFQQHRVAIVAGIRSGDPAIALVAMNRYFDAQRARFERDGSLRSLNLSSPKLITIVSDMVRDSKG